MKTCEQPMTRQEPKPAMPLNTRHTLQGVALALLALIATGSLAAEAAKVQDAKSTARPALTVTTVQPARADLPLQVAATGSIAAWQEASIGAESGGLRIERVHVNVGDTVSRGKVLANFATDSVEADLAQARASLAEGEAAAADARQNAVRAREVQGSGALSQQQISQLLTAEKTADARVLLLRAQLLAQELRLKHATVVAPDEGTISSRSATEGAVLPQGQELFRLIRGDRIEWRAEVTSSELARLRSGQPVRVVSPTGAVAEGRLRMIAPTVDAQTRNALVYVDLPVAAMRSGGFKPGMFARGEFVTGRAAAITVPLEAISLRDGFSYLFTVGADNRVKRLKVQLGRRSGEQVEVIGTPLKGEERVVASGAAFLADGDLVRVVAK